MRVQTVAPAEPTRRPRLAVLVTCACALGLVAALSWIYNLEFDAPSSLATRDPGPLTRTLDFAPGQVLEGHPVMHIADVYQSDDGNLLVAYWSASAGRFTWNYQDINEVITVVEGEAFVKTSNGITHHLLPGDTLIFDQGDSAEWTVPKYVRKQAIIHKSPRSFLGKLSDKIHHLLGE